MADDPSFDQAVRKQICFLLASLEAGGRSVLIRHDQDLLQSIVDAAAQIFGAAAASIALVDEANQRLVFKVATGIGKENVVGVSIPVSQGLAGYVVMTGQPISVRDVQQSARFNKDFATQTGYVPQSILATPLLIGDQVIGVMEVLDKINAPAFGMQDMDLLALFARQAAIAIHQMQQYDRLSDALVSGLRRLVDPQAGPELTAALDSTAETVKDDDLLAIADQYSAISRLGSAEKHACFEILQAFAHYAKSRTALY